MYRGFILPLIFLYIIGAIGLHIPPNELATSPTPVHPREISTSTDTLSTTTSTLLYLPVTLDANDDVLGIAEVSGLFGPGSWSGWFLTLVASWWRIMRASEETFDPNTAVFLFSINWTAIDVWRGISITQSIPQDALDGKLRASRGLASLGAALNLTIWGSLHAQLQLLATMMIFRSSKAKTRRLLIHSVGLILPTITLLRYTPLSGETRTPALYWHGMEGSSYADLHFYATLTGSIIIPILSWLIHTTKSVLPEDFIDSTNSTIHWAKKSLAIKIFGILSILLSIFSIARWLDIGSPGWAFGLLPLAVSLFVLFILNYSRIISTLLLAWGYTAFVSYVVVYDSTIQYVFKAYLSQTVDRSKSCFFMPCAPQAITDEDQLQTMVAGLSLFLVFEVFPIFRAKVKEWYRRREEFVQEMQRRMEELRMRQG